MKFAKELERDLVPEWRLKYLDYKTGKKKLKAIDRALRNVNNQTPRIRRRGTTYTPSPLDTAPKYTFLNRTQGVRDTSDLRSLAIHNSQASLQKPNGSHDIGRTPEELPLNGGQGQPFPGLARYGSIIGSPPNSDKGHMDKARAPPSLKLPSAALDAENDSLHAGPSASSHKKTKLVTLPPPTDNALEVRKTRSPHEQSASLPSRYKSVFSPKRVNSTPGSQVTERPALLKRVFSMNHKSPPPSPGDIPLEVYRDLDIRQSEFFGFLDMQLEKIETFYKSKEHEATERLNVLREQLHIMRDRRLYEVISLQTSKIKAKEAKKRANNVLHGHGHGHGHEHEHLSSPEDEGPKSNAKGHSLNTSWLNPIDSALEAVKAGKYGRSTNAMAEFATPSLKPQKLTDDRRDYSRRPDLPDVPYQSAKRKLKIALQEFYRGLELLKSYSLLNRTAFRKINKKYDKTVNARPSMRYMTEKVNKAWFVESDVVEGHIRQVEDLYARYFEKGNHKVAVGKLRIKSARAGDFTENSFRNGLTLAGGLIFMIQGLVLAIELLNSDDPTTIVDTSYLLQIYAGYFLMNFLFLLFCLACRFWHESKINYVFVFEYDTRHHLDWRQLAELPCFYILLLGFFMWFNFNQFGTQVMYIYYPVLLIGISTVILFFPAKILYYRSRKWLIYSIWRLVLAGLYPVEFRDFYLGDMFCSLTYAMGNIELFFCLYAHGWSTPIHCSSSQSRLLGFFAALPAIWRALQCLRRYADTKSAFPHLYNCAKYMATIMFYVTLSIYRIDKTPTNRAVFIVFAIINSLYCSFWDVIMDWSLGDFSAKYPFLRNMLGYKRVWIYYAAICIDPILRFNWIAYAIDPLQIQHSAVTSFVVAFSEVCRRGMWTIFRVENEHCTNVERFRASRDVPLPYDVQSSPEASAEDVANATGNGKQRKPGDVEAPTPKLKRAPTAAFPGTLHPSAQSSSTGADLDLARTSSSLRRRASVGEALDSSPLARGLTRVGTYLRSAHAQDFERKKKPELGRGTSNVKSDDDDYSDSSADEDERTRGSSDDAQDEDEIADVRESLERGRRPGESEEEERQDV
ncbi:EXS-domain-containing protein [Pleomassaria siparia CBS 279.74]|uniref:EXS-domain-containing protein n=1 Tax=Pleomassaria siparia CBS 279.74 TaxID=1314801 RepID=A0A6G1JT95_9PLEO|nr:EXS-domain-containing protein [Pleomassaria siparia CBS 279.74]